MNLNPPSRPPLDYESDDPRRRRVPAWQFRLGIVLWIIVALLLAAFIGLGYLHLHDRSFWR